MQDLVARGVLVAEHDKVAPALQPAVFHLEHAVAAAHAEHELQHHQESVAALENQGVLTCTWLHP
jgi:hypothetical protein